MLVVASFVAFDEVFISASSAAVASAVAPVVVVENVALNAN